MVLMETDQKTVEPKECKVKPPGKSSQNELQALSAALSPLIPEHWQKTQ